MDETLKYERIEVRSTYVTDYPWLLTLPLSQLLSFLVLILTHCCHATAE